MKDANEAGRLRMRTVPRRHICSGGETTDDIRPVEECPAETASSSPGFLDECIMAVMMLLEEVGFLLQEHLDMYGPEYLECSQPVDIKPLFSTGWSPEDPFLARYEIPDFLVEYWDHWCQTKDMLATLTREELYSLFDN